MGNTELMLNPVFPIYTKFFIVSRFVSTYIWKVGDCSTYLCQFLILESERQLLIRIINEYSVKIKPQRELINQKNFLILERIIRWHLYPYATILTLRNAEIKDVIDT